MPWVPKSDRGRGSAPLDCTRNAPWMGLLTSGRDGRVPCPKMLAAMPANPPPSRPLLLVVVGMGLGEWAAADGARRGMSGEGGAENPLRTHPDRQREAGVHTRHTKSPDPQCRLCCPNRFHL